MLEHLTITERQRMQAFFHPGAATLSAVFIDPDSADGILFFTPRWAVQYISQDRLTCVIDKKVNSAALYDAIYSSVNQLMTQRTTTLSLEDMLKKRPATCYRSRARDDSQPGERQRDDTIE
jgi:hypothetical protein